jgi:hypothetical protein
MKRSIARQQCRQADQHEIGKGDTRERHGEREFGGVARKAGGDHVQDLRHEYLADDGERDQPEGQCGGGFLGKAARHVLALGGEQVGEDGHEGGIEGAFAEEAAEEVWQAVGEEEGVRHGTRAQEGGDEHVADEAHHAAGGGPAADCHGSTKQG